MSVTGIISQYRSRSAGDWVMSRSDQGTPRSAATRSMTARASSHKWQPGRDSRVISATAQRPAGPAPLTRRWPARGAAPPPAGPLPPEPLPLPFTVLPYSRVKSGRSNPEVS
jgi:hypothetical protein